MIFANRVKRMLFTFEKRKKKISPNKEKRTLIDVERLMTRERLSSLTSGKPTFGSTDGAEFYWVL